MTEASGKSRHHLMDYVSEVYDQKTYQELTWEGTLSEYLDVVAKNPKVSRTAYKRVYDMIMKEGSETYVEYKKKITRYKFFDDPFDNGKDAVFGLDIPLMKLVNVFQSAARRYGTEKRIILLHGPVGGSKSTIARVLKKGLEAYTRTPEGALYSYTWIKGDAKDDHHKAELDRIFGASVDEFPCPMHAEPLLLIPEEVRADVIGKINKDLPPDEQVYVEGDLCPPCRFIFKEMMHLYDGDWQRVMAHVKVRRVILSEKDRIGIGTNQKMKRTRTQLS